MRSVLFITAEKTGGGHRSITSALVAQLQAAHPGMRISEVDGFSLGGVTTDAAGRVYNTLARLAPWLWNAIYSTGNVVVRPLNFVVGHMIRKRLLAKVDETHPDLIVSVHASYVGSVLNALHAAGRDIPVVSVVADLDNVSYLWADRRCVLTFCPTRESLETMRRRGVPEDRLVLSGFPVRDQFTSIDVDPSSPLGLEGRPIRFLLMSGSQGGAKTAAYAEALLRRFDCEVTIVAGRDPILRELLERQMAPSHDGRVHVLGFVEDLERHMLAADILLLRGSPNAMMEAVMLCRPFIVIGAFAGQEAKNPAYAEREGIGVRGTNIATLGEVVGRLLADGGAEMQRLRANEWRYRRPEAAREMAAMIAALAEPLAGSESDAAPAPPAAVPVA